MSIRRFVAGVFVIFAALSLLSAQSVYEKNRYCTQITTLENNVFTTKYGNLKTDVDATDFMACGFEWGDIVNVAFLDKSISMPIVPNLSYVDSGLPAVRVERDDSGLPCNTVGLGINMGDFTEAYGIAAMTTESDNSWYWTANEGVTLPFDIVFTMGEKQGFIAEYQAKDLVYSTERSDYPDLSDEQYANFRKVETTGMHGNLYRSSTPVRAKYGRNVQADEACRKAGVSIAINMADSRSEAEARDEFKGTYYSTIDVKYIPLALDFSSQTVKTGLAEGLRYMSENKGIYLLHCNEGKDRTGFVVAVLECLMGASADEVIDDYMETFFNYYGIEKGSDKYDAIVESNLKKTLENEFEVDDIFKADLRSSAESYLLSIGLSSSEIDKLKANL